MASFSIRNALISVFNKDGLEPVLEALDRMGVQLFSTGGTQAYLEERGYEVTAVESLTGFPSILDGRVKTLHPAIFGGILARREPDHLAQLEERNLPQIDLVVVDLYPFEETVARSKDEREIIEKIDIGGISLIRAAAKNYQDVAIVPSRAEYSTLLKMLDRNGGELSLEDRRTLALRAFKVSSGYDRAIAEWFDGLAGMPESFEEAVDSASAGFAASASPAFPLRYGENPHQGATFYGDLDRQFRQLSGKALSFNNLVDVDAALALISELEHGDPAAVVIKHTNACGVAQRDSLVDAWHAALAADPVSAFGGILAFNRSIDLATAKELDKLFFEVLLAPGYEEGTIELLKAKKNRILLQVNNFARPALQFRSMLGGVLQQDSDLHSVSIDDLKVVTKNSPSQEQIGDLLFANLCVKHLKSNAIALVKDRQLLGMGCGQTSRVDALRQAIQKAQSFGFELQGCSMASDAFFPFPDCVEISAEHGIAAIIQPGGSIKDADSVAAADHAGIAMVMSGFRHFKH